MQRLLPGLAAATGGLLACAAALGWVVFRRPPVNPPLRGGSSPVVVVAGDSLVHGTVGTDWVAALRRRSDCRGLDLVNAGRNGDTCADLLERIGRDVLDRRPAEVVVMIGTNDLLGGAGPERYRERLGAIVEVLRTGSRARIALASLPPFGEDPDSPSNQRVRAFNAVVAELARGVGADYLPVHERMVEVLRERGTGAPAFGYRVGLAFRSAVRHLLLRHSWDGIARGRGLHLLVDHLHLNDRAGAIVADLVAGHLAGRLADGAAEGSRNAPPARRA